MQLPGSRDQQLRDHQYCADLTLSGSSQLLLPERKSCSFLLISNNSAANVMWLEFGSARATAAISATGLVTGFTVTNGGFGFLQPPEVLLFGGGTGGNPLFTGATMPNWPAPGDAGFAAPRQGSTTDRIAKAHAVLTTGVVTSLVVDDPGSGYVAAPYVFMQNSLNPPDHAGVADPNFGGTKSGIQLNPGGGTYYVNGTHCTTDAIAIFGINGDHVTCRWAP